MGLPNVKFAPTGVPTIGEMVGMAAQAVGDGLCTTCLVIYPCGNLEGRYRRGGENADDYARGARQWTVPWGNHGGNDFINTFPHNQYCLKYGGHHDDLAPFVINQHKNGMLTPWGFNATHGIEPITVEDYVNSRYILNPLRIWDCDRPVQASTAYLFTTADRAKDMRQKPVYVLNHSQHNFKQPSTQADLDVIEMWTDRAAKRMYEGAGLGPKDVDIFNPYDGYSVMTQFYLEAFQWHGVKRGDALTFYAGDISVKGPHPFSSSGGNLGNGRMRSAMYTDSIEQLRGTAGSASGEGAGRDRAGGVHHAAEAAAGSCSASIRAKGTMVHLKEVQAWPKYMVKDTPEAMHADRSRVKWCCRRAHRKWLKAVDGYRSPAFSPAYFSRTTGLRSTPMSVISTSTTSPSCMFSVAPSVPIHSTSPG